MRTRFVCFSCWIDGRDRSGFCSAARGQYGGALPGPGWQVMKADWGAGNRWADVTTKTGPGPGRKPGYGDLQIVRAYYGLNQRTNDVTQRVRGMVNKREFGRRAGAGSGQGADGDLPGESQGADGNGERGNTLRIP